MKPLFTTDGWQVENGCTEMFQWAQSGCVHLAPLMNCVISSLVLFQREKMLSMNRFQTGRFKDYKKGKRI